MILIVQSDALYRQHLQASLQEIDIVAKCVGDIGGARDALSESVFDVVLLDTVIDGGSGFDLCQEIVHTKSAGAVVFVSGCDSAADRVLGLELGADDFIQYPCHARELQARLKVQMKHLKVTADTPKRADILSHGPLTIDIRQHEVRVKQQSIALTATEFTLISYLASHPNQVFTRMQLLDAVWGYSHCGYEHTVNSHVNRLRTKLAEAAELIETVWGVGYKFHVPSTPAPVSKVVALHSST